MIRTLFLVLAILAVAVMPNPAHGGGGGHGGHGHHHRHHHGHRHFHHFSSFVFVYDPFLYYPYPYYYPYPVYSPPVVVEPPPVVYQPPAVQREVIYPNGKYEADSAQIASQIYLAHQTKAGSERLATTVKSLSGELACAFADHAKALQAAAQSSGRYARGLNWATWALVGATVVLAFLTAMQVWKGH